MSTEIGQLKNVQTTAAQERERVSRGPADAPGTSRGGAARSQTGTDEVRLSSSALKLQEAERRLALHPEIDQARVDAIRESLKNGTYEVHAGRVAEGLLAQEHMLLTGGAR